jgi:glycosyltransferase involved in cell wall biosynthesis
VEVLVSNNASTDRTEEILESFDDDRLRVLRQEKTIPMMENWNACLSAATGEFFLLLSDDDLLEKTAIEEMVVAFERANELGTPIGFVYCDGTMIEASGKPMSLSKASSPAMESSEDIIVAFFNGERRLWPCSILYRTADLAPGYDLSFALEADAVQWIRAVTRYGAARFVDKKLTRYRVHQNATFSTPVKQWHRENLALAEFAASKLSGSSKDTLAKIRAAVRRLNIRITPLLLNDSLNKSTRLVLREYWENIRIFEGYYGLLFFLRGTMPLMLPRFIRAWVRRCVNSTAELE